MNRIFSVRLSGVQSLAIRDICGRLTFTRFYAAKKGKKKKNAQVAFDPDLAEEFVDLQKLRSNMQSSLEKLRQDYINKITLQIRPNSFDHIRVEKDNQKVPLGQIAEISLKNDQMVVVDMSNSPMLTRAAAQAIKDMGMNYEPVVEGQMVTFTLPKMTQDYRENLAKLAKLFCENSKQGIRRVRQKGLSDVRKNKQGKSEDGVRLVEKMIQQLTEEFSESADVLLDAKTKELMRR